MTETRALIENILDAARDAEEFSTGGMYREMTAEHIAEDLCAFNDAMETVSPHEAQPIIADWMSRQQWLNGNPNEVQS